MIVDAFATTERGIDDAAPGAALGTGPVVRVEAPAGGPVWIVTDPELARQVLVDPRIAKDPGWAPEHWGPDAGLELPAAVQPSLTTLDGPAHTELRRAHAPLFTARRMRDENDHILAITRAAFASLSLDDPIELAVALTPRLPLLVLLDLLGSPVDQVDEAVVACGRILDGDFSAMATLSTIAAAGVAAGGGLAAELRHRLPDAPDQELYYHLFGIILAGQITTETALGFALANALHTQVDPADAGAVDALVRDTLRTYPPAPVTLWRFTVEEIDLAGHRLPARSPVLVDLRGISADGAHDMIFGSGAHFCLGAQLALAELRAAITVLRADYPGTTLAVDRSELRVRDVGGVLGTRLTSLPVVLRR